MKQMKQPKIVDLRKNILLKNYYNFSYWVQNKFWRSRLFKRAAIHESGHIVFSYFYGYTIGQAELSIINPGNGVALIVYGDKTVAANIVLHNWPEHYLEGDAAVRKRIIKTAISLLVIAASGSVAETFFFRKKYFKLSADDLETINKIQLFLNEISVANDGNYAAFAFKMYKLYPIFKCATEVLTNNFLNSVNYSLTQQRIEEILTEVNFFNEINLLKALN